VRILCFWDGRFGRGGRTGEVICFFTDGIVMNEWVSGLILGLDESEANYALEVW
jgi:hypothetical protein